jgi:integrase
MTHPSSHGADSRRQVEYQGRPVPNLYVRQTKDGRLRFEFVSKRGGRVRKLTLQATSTRQAVRELENLQPLASAGKIGAGTVRLDALSERFFAEAKTGEYAPKGRYASSTLELYRQKLSQHVIPKLGNRRVRDITKPDAQALADRLALTHAGSTVRGTIVALAAVLSFAEHRGLIQANPVVRLKLPSARRRKEPRYLSRGELDALLEALSDKSRPIAAVCALAGLRVSEAIGLVWADVDLGAEELHVRQQLGRDGKTLVGPKTRSSAATVGIPARLATELRQHRDRAARRGFDRIAADALVFQTRTGRPVSRRNVLRAIQTQADKLGLEGLTSHGLRHSCAGLLRDAGISDEDISVTMRHANSQVTSVMYGGRAEEAKARVRAAARKALA